MGILSRFLWNSAWACSSQAAESVAVYFRQQPGMPFVRYARRLKEIENIDGFPQQEVHTTGSAGLRRYSDIVSLQAVAVFSHVIIE